MMIHINIANPKVSCGGLWEHWQQGDDRPYIIKYETVAIGDESFRVGEILRSPANTIGEH